MSHRNPLFTDRIHCLWLRPRCRPYWWWGWRRGYRAWAPRPPGAAGLTPPRRLTPGRPEPSTKTKRIIQVHHLLSAQPQVVQGLLHEQADYTGLTPPRRLTPGRPGPSIWTSGLYRFITSPALNPRSSRSFYKNNLIIRFDTFSALNPRSSNGLLPSTRT